MSVVHRISYLLRSSAAALAVGVAGVLAAPAAAQLDGGSALADLNRPDYIHRDMQIFSQGLNLDDAQRMILDSLFQDYLDGFESGWQQTQSRIQELLEDVQAMEASGDQSGILDMVIAPFEEWRSGKQRLKERFEGDVQAILNPEQSERWPQFMQQITREKTLHLGRLSGESLNLFHIVNDLRIDDRALLELEPVLEQYSDELHQALMQRNEIVRRGQTDFIRGLRTQGSVPPPRFLDEELGARVRIRDVNLRYVDEIAARLPEQHTEQFRKSAAERSFPRVYRQLPAMSLITRALNLDDLDEDTRSMIEEIRETFLVEMERFNRELRDALLDFEPRQLRNQTEMAAARHSGQSVSRIDDPTRPKFIERDERAQYYAQMVQGLLTPEQAGMVPGEERRISGRARERGGAVTPRGERGEREQQDRSERQRDERRRQAERDGGE